MIQLTLCIKRHIHSLCFLSLILSQLIVPASAIAQVDVEGYTRSDGTYVDGYTRSAPNDSLYDNRGYQDRPIASFDSYPDAAGIGQTRGIPERGAYRIDSDPSVGYYNDGAGANIVGD